MRRFPSAFGELSIHAEMNFESRGIRSSFDPSKIPARRKHSRPEVEERWRGKTFLFVLLFLSFSFLCNQLGWGELCRDDRSGKSGWIVEIEPSVSTIGKSFSFFGIVGASKNVVSTKSILREVSSRPLEQVYIKIFWLKWNFRFLDYWLV